MTETLLVAGITIVVQLLTGAYVYGKLTNEVVNLRAWLALVSSKADKLETRLSRLEGAEGITR